MLERDDSNEAGGGALSDVRVVEWGRGIATAYAGKILADFGAQVIRFGNHDSYKHCSIESATYLHERKIRPGVGPQKNALVEFLTDADILVCDLSAPERRGAGIDSTSLSKINPGLISVAVTPFGLSGPYSAFRGGDLEVAFLSGLSILTPRDIASSATGDETPPLKMPGSLVSFYAGASAAGAALTALHGRQHESGVQEVDVSMLESLIPTLRREIALYHYESKVASRFMRVWRLAPWGVKRCKDGYVFLQVVERYHWEGLVDMMSRPEWALDPRYLDADCRFENRVDIEQRMEPWLLAQEKNAFAWESQRRRLPFASVNELSDLVRIPQLHHRRFFRCAAAPDGRSFVVPGTPFHVVSELPGKPAHPRTGAVSKRSGARKRPLEDIRVIDFGHVWAGPYCTAILADMGAEVIKVESLHRLDVHRRQGPYPDGQSGVNRSGVWNAQNRGKRSVTLNLSLPRGRDLARRLVAAADVVVENFAPDVMTRLELDYTALQKERPGIVMASLSAFGQDGPQKEYVGYGPSLDAWAGLDALTAYCGGAPNALGGVFPDTGSALHAVAAILAALHRRDRTGMGCYIDLSELEVSILLMADLVAEELGGSKSRPTGNSHSDQFPYGCYRCAGDDQWIALSVPDATVWNALCAIVGRTAWKDEEAYGTSEGRRLHAAQIEPVIAAWASTRTADAAMQTLQACGVPSGMAHSSATLLADPHLKAREFFQVLDHPEAGGMPVYGPIWRFGESSEPIARPAPCLGEDNDHVLRTLLQLSDTEIDVLVSEKVIY